MIHDPENINLAMDETLTLRYLGADGDWYPLQEVSKPHSPLDDFRRPEW